MAKSVLWVWAAMVIAVAACSGTTSSTSSVSADQACTDAAGALCDRFAACAPAFVQLGYGDASTCKTRFKPSCTSSFSANGSSAKPGDIEACSNAYKSVSCDDIFAGTEPAACDFHGSLMPGAACAGNSQCSGANGYCNIPSGKTCGVCGTRVAAGGTCTQNADCQRGLVCGMAACVAPAAAGAACDGPHPCIGSLVCAGGTCAQPGGAGASCTTDANCDAKQALYCNSATMICATVQWADAGGACGVNFANRTYTACKASGYCKMAGMSGTGTCQAPAADGATCNTTTGPNCLPPAVCTNGACATPDPASCL